MDITIDMNLYMAFTLAITHKHVRRAAMPIFTHYIWAYNIYIADISTLEYLPSRRMLRHLLRRTS